MKELVNLSHHSSFGCANVQVCVALKMFICLAALSLNLAAYKIFHLRCGMQTLSWGMWDLVPDQSSNPDPLHWEQRS